MPKPETIWHPFVFTKNMREENTKKIVTPPLHVQNFLWNQIRQLTLQFFAVIIKFINYVSFFYLTSWRGLKSKQSVCGCESFI